MKPLKAPLTCQRGAAGNVKSRGVAKQPFSRIGGWWELQLPLPAILAAVKLR